MSRVRPVAITVAPNGSYKTKADHPAVPLTLPELVDCAVACHEAGAGMFHLHVRDAAGGHLLDAEAYRAATRAIRTAVGPGLVIQPTSEAAGRYGPQAQMHVVEGTQPEAVSLALREIVPDEDGVSAASAFIGRLEARETAIQVILYSADDLARYRALRQRGAFGTRRQALLFVLGRYTPGQRSSPADILPFMAEHVDQPFGLCAFGAAEQDCVLTSALLGGDARVGFENNLLMPDGGTAPDNTALVVSLVGALAAIGRRPARADEIRSQYAEGEGAEART